MVEKWRSEHAAAKVPDPKTGDMVDSMGPHALDVMELLIADAEKAGGGDYIDSITGWTYIGEMPVKEFNGMGEIYHVRTQNSSYVSEKRSAAQQCILSTRLSTHPTRISITTDCSSFGQDGVLEGTSFRQY